MTGQELARRLMELVVWVEGIQTHGDVDPGGNALHVEAGTLLEETLAQAARLVAESQGLPAPKRTPLIYRVSELRGAGQ